MKRERAGKISGNRFPATETPTAPGNVPNGATVRAQGRHARWLNSTEAGTRTRHVLGENLLAACLAQRIALQGEILVYGRKAGWFFTCLAHWQMMRSA